MGVVDISAMDAYSGVEVLTHIPEWRYARQYLWVRLVNNVGSKSFLKKNQNSIGYIP
jgi:hypothetical protein